MILDDNQKRAVTYGSGPLAINAGSGSGKTRSIIERISYMLQNNIYHPDKIYVATFTNEAADEMIKRLKVKNIKGVKSLHIGTLHSIFYKLYRDIERNFNPYYIGIPKLINEYKQYKFFKDQAKKYCSLFGMDKPPIHPYFVPSKISWFKSNGMDYKEFISVNKLTISKSPAKTDFHFITFMFNEYEKHLKSNNLIDFDDMLLRPYLLMKRDEKKLNFVRGKVKYLYVDESQDNNALQHNLVELVTSPTHNFTVVFDARQSIYGFNNASPKNLFSLLDRVKANIIDLDLNYRSLPEIVDHANLLMEKSNIPIRSSMKPVRVGSAEISMIEPTSEYEEAMQVYSKIYDLMLQGHKLSDMVVVYRTHAQGVTLANLLMINKIPYKVIGGANFYKRKEIKVAIAYLKASSGMDITASEFQDMCFFPNKFVSGDCVDKIKKIFKGNVFEALSQIQTLGLRYNSVKGLSKLRDDLYSLSSVSNLTSKVITLYNDIGLKKFAVNQRNENAEDISELKSGLVDVELNLEALLSIVKNFETLGDFLDHIELLKSKKVKGKDFITLQSIHSIKGGEVKIVFILGISEGLLPYYMADTPEDIEEERRIFFVALTRAKDKLILSALNGNYGSKKVKPSRFLWDAGLNTKLKRISLL